MFAKLADRVILCPTTDEIAVEEKTRHLIEFEHGQLEVWKQWVDGHVGDEPDLYVLKFPGTGGRAERAGPHPADLWPDVRAEIWAVNPPGYGGSTGPASIGKIAAMAQTVLDDMASQAAGRPILVTGNSLGCVSALYLAARNPGICGLLLRNPLPLRELIIGHHGWWNLTIGARMIARNVPGELCSLRNAASCHVPAVFISSGKDTVVPEKYQRQVIDCYDGPHRVFARPDADHDCPLTDQELPAYRDELDWLRGELTSSSFS